MSTHKKSLNRVTLMVFAPLLILLGVSGFLIPAEKSLASGAASYNIFHIVFGVIGVCIWLMRDEMWAIIFNTGFGLIDLYQAFASYAGLFPERYFRWTRVDDIAHVVVGLMLVLVGLYGLAKRGRGYESPSARGA